MHEWIAWLLLFARKAFTDEENRGNGFIVVPMLTAIILVCVVISMIPVVMIVIVVVVVVRIKTFMTTESV